MPTEHILETAYSGGVVEAQCDNCGELYTIRNRNKEELTGGACTLCTECNTSKSLRDEF